MNTFNVAAIALAAAVALAVASTASAATMPSSLHAAHQVPGVRSVPDGTGLLIAGHIIRHSAPRHGIVNLTIEVDTRAYSQITVPVSAAGAARILSDGEHARVVIFSQVADALIYPARFFTLPASNSTTQEARQ